MQGFILLFTLFFIQIEGFAKTKAQVYVELAQPTSFSDLLVFPARVESEIQSTLLAEREGIVNKLFVTLGKHVKKNTSILSLEQSDPAFKYAPLVISAPVSGTVSEIHVGLGMRVQKGQKLFSVIDPKKLEIQIEATSADLGSLSKNLTGTFEVNNGTHKSWPVVIQGMSPVIDPLTGTAAVTLKLKNQENLLPGMIGQVQFKVNQRQALAIPESAIVYTGKDPFIRIVESGKVKKIPLKLGKSYSGRIEIVDGLKTGQTVITRTSKFVSENDEVEIAESKK